MEIWTLIACLLEMCLKEGGRGGGGVGWTGLSGWSRVAGVCGALCCGGGGVGV